MIFERKEITDSINDKNKIIIFLVSSVLILLGLKISILTICAFAILSIYLMRIKNDEVIELLFFFLPFINIFKLNKDGTSLFTYLQLIAILKIMCSEGKNLAKKGVLAGMILLMYSFFSMQINNSSFSVEIRFCIEVLLLIIVFATSLHCKIDAKRIVLFYVAGIICASIYGCFNSIIPEMNSYFSRMYTRLNENSIIYRFSGLSENSNYYSIDVTLAQAALFVLLKHKLIGKSFYLYFGVLTIFGIMSQSKTYIISLIILVLLYLHHLTMSHRLSNAFLALVSVIVTISLLNIIFGNEYIGYFSRFISVFSENASIDDVTTGRWNIWNQYLKLLPQKTDNFFLGYGIETYSMEIGYEAHNVFVQSLYCFGLLGSAIYFGFIMTIKGKTRHFSSAIAFSLLLFIRLLAANLLFYPNTYYYLILLLILIDCSNVSSMENEERYCEESV